MSRGRRGAAGRALFFALAILGAGPSGAQPAGPAPTHVCHLPVEPPAEFRGDGAATSGEASAHAFRVSCPAPTARFEVTYSGFPDAARAAFQAAVDTWSCLVASTVPIRVAARWEALAPTTLGSAGPYLVRNAPGAPLRETWYPSALADALAGRDLDARTADIDAAFNLQFPDWHLDPDAPPPAGTFDLYTVVLHELGHGLGVIGGLAVESGRGVVGRGSSRGPFIYDRFTEDGAGTPLLDARTYPDGSVALAEALTSPVWFDGVAVRQAGGRVRLYTPDPWTEGASYAHLDETAYPADTPDGLMTPFLRRGEAIDMPGAATCGLLGDLGWALAGRCADLVGPLATPVVGVSVERLGSNPFAGETSVRLRAAAPQRLRVTLADALGRTVAVYADDVLPAGVGAEVRVDARGLAAGVYWLVIAGDSGRTSVPLTVVR